MKKFCLIIRVSLILLFGNISLVNADNVTSKSAKTEVLNVNPRIEKSTALISRLNEIKSIDLKHVSSTERKELRKEVKKINLQLKQLGNGFYISTGAAIIIILLLILIL